MNSRNCGKAAAVVWEMFYCDFVSSFVEILPAGKNKNGRILQFQV